MDTVANKNYNYTFWHYQTFIPFHFSKKYKTKFFFLEIGAENY